jgi:hypothetical protein
MKIPFRPLGEVRDIVQTTGLDISYAYDDLLFSDNSVFILRFDNDVDKKMYLYFNSDCNSVEAGILEKRLKTAGKIGGFEISKAGLFTLEQLSDKEEIQVKFLS